jgi:hypothetical protein
MIAAGAVPLLAASSNVLDEDDEPRASIATIRPASFCPLLGCVASMMTPSAMS